MTLPNIVLISGKKASLKRVKSHSHDKTFGVAIEKSLTIKPCILYKPNNEIPALNSSNSLQRNRNVTNCSEEPGVCTCFAQFHTSISLYVGGL